MTSGNKKKEPSITETIERNAEIEAALFILENCKNTAPAMEILKTHSPK